MLDSSKLLVLSNFGVWREGLAAQLSRALPGRVIEQADFDAHAESLLHGTRATAPRVIVIETEGRRRRDLQWLQRLARLAPPDCRLLLMVPPDLAAKAEAFVSREISFQQLLALLQPRQLERIGCRPLQLPDLLRRLQAHHRRSEAPDRRPTLTARERDVLVLLQQGMSNQALADRLDLSIHTVKNHVHHILDKLGVRRRAQAVDEALRRGWLPPTPDPSDA